MTLQSTVITRQPSLLGPPAAPTDSSERRQRGLTNAGAWVTRIAIATTVIIALAGRLVYLFRPFDPDGAIFIYMGKLTASGGRVGYELIDNKFPTVGLLTSAAWRVCGNWWPGYVLLQTVLIGLACLYLSRTCARCFGARTRLPALLAGLVMLNFNPAVFGGFQLESIQSFFSILAACAAVSCLCDPDARDALVAGLCAGSAAMSKPSGLAVLAAFAIAIGWQHRAQPLRVLRLGGACLAGLAFPLLVVITYLKAANLFSMLPSLFRQISDYARSTPLEVWDWSKPLVALCLVLAPALFCRVLRRASDSRAERLDGWESRADDRARALMFVWIWLALETAGVIAQRRMYAYHFFVLAGPAAFLVALTARRVQTTLVALAPLALLSVLSLTHLPHLQRPGQTLAVSEYLHSHAQPGDSAWQDEMSRLLLETGLSPGSRYAATFLWVNNDLAPARFSQEMMEDFEQKQTTWIVLPADMDWYVPAVANHIKELGLSPTRRERFIDAWGAVRRYVEMHYVRQATIGKQSVYRRR